jgi:chromosome partitioning protein
MSVVVFGIPKGGAGKTTSSLVLATELANLGASVTMVDGDPNKHLVDWAALGNVPSNLDVIGDVTEETIMDVIEEASARSTFVIADMEGTANLMVGYAISMADLVIIPVQGSQLDAKKAAHMIRFILQQERAVRRPIPYAVLITRTSPAITPGTQKFVERKFVEHKTPVLQTRLYDREAYRALFSYGGTLRDLKDKVAANSLETAQRNAYALAAEIVDRLRTNKDELTSAEARMLPSPAMTEEGNDEAAE